MSRQDLTRRQRPRVHTSMTALALSCLSRRTATTRFRYRLRTSRPSRKDWGGCRQASPRSTHPSPPPPRHASSSLSITLFVLIHTPMLESSTSYPWFLLHGTQTFEMSIAGTAYSDPKLNQQPCRVLEEATVRPSPRPPACFLLLDIRRGSPRPASYRVRPPRKKAGASGLRRGTTRKQLDVIFRWRRMGSKKTLEKADVAPGSCMYIGTVYRADPGRSLGPAPEGTLLQEVCSSSFLMPVTGLG
jgi:hypothetical protein